MASKSQQSKYVRVGIFVALGLVVAGFLVFIIGDERHMFESKARMRTTFRDVGGLRVGSPVRMGGIDVGAVTSIEFSNDVQDPLLHVEFNMVRSSFRRVRTDSVARIVSKGLLGDKALEISVGDPRQPALADGGTVRADESTDIMQTATSMLNRANGIIDSLVAAIRPLGNDRLANDLLGLLRDVRTITNQIATGNGTVGRLLRDDSMGRELEGTLSAAQSAMRNINGATAQVGALVRDARTGRGLLHSLIYDPQGGQVVRSLGRAADEMAAITHDVRTGNGGLHDIIYGQESTNAIRNVNEATAAVRDILRDVQRGRGTLGALLVDPSLYEDLRNLVGNVQRNEILRALVRYSIHADERRAPVGAREGSAQDSGTGASGGTHGTTAPSAPGTR